MGMERPTWDQIWSDFAKIIAQRSYDPRFKVGAVIVTDDNTQVLAVGYNGNHRGGNNALIKMDYNNPKRKKMYVTLSPCLACAKLILNASIDEVFYLEDYRDSSGIDLLREFGVIVNKIGD
jgi:dCMP deaminase